VKRAITPTLLFALLLPLMLGLRPAAPKALHSPHDVIAAWAISPDYASDHTLFLALPRFNLVLRSDDAGGSFRTVNAGLDTAYVQHIAISPDFRRDRTLYCIEIGGLFVTHDAGDRWERVSLPPELKNPTAVIFSPRWIGDQTLLVSTVRSGLWASRDADATWERVPLPVNQPVTAMHWSPDGNLLALAGQRTVLHSADDAGRFVVLPPPPGELQSVLAADAYGFDGSLWVGTKDGVWRTAHHAEEWTRVGTGSDGSNVLHLALATGAADEEVLFASTAVKGVLIREGERPWRSSRRGLREPSHQTALHFLGTLPSPDFAEDRTVFAATFEGLYRSFDAGESWEWVNVLHPALVRNLALSPRFGENGRLAVSSYGGGLLGSEDRGMSFTTLDTAGWMFPDGVAITETEGERATLLIGTPNRLLISRNGGLLSIEAMAGARGFARTLSFAPDFAQGGIAFAHLSTDTGNDTNRFVRTEDGGGTWSDTNLRTVYDLAYSSNWAEDGRAYAACPDGVYLSVDRGKSFARMDALDAVGINSVETARGADGRDMIMAASRGTGIHLSRDGGLTWSNLHGGLGATRVAHVALSPGFAVDGLAFAGTLNNGVWITRDGGEVWTRTEGGPNLALAMAISSTFLVDTSLLVGSYDGAWLSQDAGTTWQQLDLPLPDAVRPISTRDRGTPGIPRDLAPAPDGESRTGAEPGNPAAQQDPPTPQEAPPAKNDLYGSIVWLLVLLVVVVIAMRMLRPS
jgi:photosystem II stability/assembly factor-like uncharacterized protein